MKEIIIGVNDAEQRLDRFLKKYLAKAPLSAIYKIIRKDIKLNGKRPKEDDFVHEGDVISIYLMDEEIEKFSEKKRMVRAKKQFSICYEDEDILVANKPFGLLTHGDQNEKKNTLTNQVIDYLIEKGEYVPRLEKSFCPAPVHRLDRNTTGLVVFGKNAKALRRGTDDFRKYYKAICLGNIETIVKPLLSNEKYTLVEVELLTGRSHQIRAHLASIGHPIVGDPKYGHGSAQLLHAAKLELDGKEILAPLPKEFTDQAAKIFGKDKINGIK